jgi:hypothetical protein
MAMSSIILPHEAVDAVDSSADVTDAVRSRGHLSSDITSYIKSEPIKSLTLACAAGFVLGGGLNSRLGVTMITLASRIALRGLVINGLADSLMSKRYGSARNHATA